MKIERIVKLSLLAILAIVFFASTYAMDSSSSNSLSCLNDLKSEQRRGVKRKLESDSDLEKSNSFKKKKEELNLVFDESLDDVEFEIKEEKAVNKAVIIKAEDGSQEKLPVSLLLSFDFFKDATEGEQDKCEGVKAIIELVSKNAFLKNKTQLELFARSLEFIKEKKDYKETPRTIVEELSTKILLGEHFEDLVDLWNISNFLDIKILCSSIANCIALNHKEKMEQFRVKHGSFVDSLLQRFSLSRLAKSFTLVGNISYMLSNYYNCLFCQNRQLRDQLIRMHKYVDANDINVYEEKEQVRFYNNLVEDGFLPSSFKNLSKEAILEKLFDEKQFSNEEVDRIILQLPHSNQRTYLIQELIKKKFKSKNFSFIDWYLKLPEGRENNSPRTQILNFLQNEAEKIVGERLGMAEWHDQEQFISLNLPENYFKMLVRYKYYQKKNVLIDDYRINDIWDGVFDNDFVDLARLNLTMLDGIIDLLIIKDEINSIEALYWNNNQISIIPESICNLRNLKILGFGRNQISTIPERIGDLRNLRKLWFNDNQISVIPESIGNLRNLKILGFDNNQISVIPGVIGNLRNLEILWFGRNQINAIPEAIGNLENLTELGLGHNRIGVIPGIIGNLRNLETLLLNNNQISVIPETIGNLRNLRVLLLNHNPIEEEKEEKKSSRR